MPVALKRILAVVVPSYDLLVPVAVNLIVFGFTLTVMEETAPSFVNIKAALPTPTAFTVLEAAEPSTVKIFGFEDSTV